MKEGGVMMKQLRKIPSLIQINLKNMLSNRMVLISLAACIILLAIVCSGLIDEYEEKSSIPIGIVDLDQSAMSKEVVQKLSTLEGVVLQEGTIEEQEEKLKDEFIFAYFVIKPGFEEAINSYKYKELVHMVYLGENQFVSMLSDVFAQAMMKDIITKQGERLYGTFPQYEKLIYTTDYDSFIKNEFEENEESFAFYYHFYNATEDGTQTSAAVSNNLISTELFLSLGGIFLAFFIMQVIACMEKRVGVCKRTHLSMISWWVMELADFLTVLIMEIVVSVPVLVYCTCKLSIPISGHLLSLAGICAVYLISITLLFIVLKGIVKNKVVYQFTGFLIVLAIGSLSILHKFGQLHIEWIVELVKKIPNYWFIGGITDIILGGNTIAIMDVLPSIAILAILYGCYTFVKYKNLEK